MVAIMSISKPMLSVTGSRVYFPVVDFTPEVSIDYKHSQKVNNIKPSILFPTDSRIIQYSV